MYNTKIVNKGTSLVGAEKIADSLSLTILFVDQSNASITLSVQEGDDQPALEGEAKSAESSDTDSSSEAVNADNIVCTLDGDIRRFRVDCIKPIKSFTIGFITAGKRFQYSGSINGVKYNADIENKGSSLEGSEATANSLDITINFEDSTTALLPLRTAKPQS